MNIFILNTGRCGSSTFIKACNHISNYSATHESLSTSTGAERLAYPENHIEADNRLSWFLGRLEKKYADTAFYVYLKRDKQQTIDSFIKREGYGIMQAYKEGILLGGEETQSASEIAADYIETVESNIELFLQNKTKKMTFNLENSVEDFSLFYKKIAAKGNIDTALAEWKTYYNSST